MKLVYRGKTKDVYELDAASLHLVFTDRVTKNDAGEIDPGGNNLAEETVPGQAEACLLMSSAIFSEIAEKNIARTHMIACDLEKLSMDVRRARMFKPGLEWVTRWVGTGSFIRRYGMVPGVQDGMRLPPVTNHQDVLVKLPLLPVQRREHVPVRRGLNDDLPPGNRVQIIGMHRLPVLLHHVVGNVNQVVDWPDAHGGQPPLH